MHPSPEQAADPRASYRARGQPKGAGRGSSPAITPHTSACVASPSRLLLVRLESRMLRSAVYVAGAHNKNDEALRLLWSKDDERW